MPVKASAEKGELILKIYKYFGAESKWKAPFYAWNKVIDKTVQALDISRSFLNKILKKEPVGKVFQSLYFDTFKECFFSKVTCNFLIQTYSFFEKKIQLLLSLLSLYQNYPKNLCIYSQIFH
jgi:hypothetical protein